MQIQKKLTIIYFYFILFTSKKDKKLIMGNTSTKKQSDSKSDTAANYNEALNTYTLMSPCLVQNPHLRNKILFSKKNQKVIEAFLK